MPGALLMAPTSSLLRLTTAGSVDDGKSTLVGRLLHDTSSILADQLDAVTRATRERGGGLGDQPDLALLTDGLRAEREQGITIDVAYRYFATPSRKFILADCPGHVQYTRNTVTGASTAELAVVLVDARGGVLKQTRRHLAVAAFLRVPHVVLAVNKMDLVGFDETTFRRIESDFAAAAASLGVPDVVSVPVSALLGDNVATRSARTPWYAGPTLLEHLETVPIGREAVEEPMRFPVQLVIRPRTAEFPDYRGLAGRLASGVV
ncbi:MAG: GTP-binding protein, partial [Actinomycetota bacterium]|nr:GTP-binding protein [Actinomycetota bacterium]